MSTQVVVHQRFGTQLLSIERGSSLLNYTAKPIQLAADVVRRSFPHTRSIHPTTAPLGNRTILNNLDLVNYQTFRDVISKIPTDSNREPASISAGALGTEDMVSDISFLIRVCGQIATDSPVYQLMGLPTAVNTFQGFNAANKAYNRLQSSLAIGDAPGRVEAGIDLARGSVQGAGGAVYLGYRATGTASEIMHVNTSIHATTPLGTATFSLSVIGGILFSLLYLFMGARAGYLAFSANSLRTKMNESQDSTSMTSFLIAQSRGDIKDKVAKLKSGTASDQTKFKKKLKEAALEELSTQYLKWQDHLKSEGKLTTPPLSKDAAKRVIEKIYSAVDTDTKSKNSCERAALEGLDISSEEIAFLNLSALEFSGLKIENRHRQQRIDANLSRIIGADTLGKIKKAHDSGLLERLESKDPVISEPAKLEAEELEKTVRSALSSSIIICATLVFIAVVGIAATIGTIGLFATPPGVAIALTVLTVLLVVVMTGFDYRFFKKNIDQSAPGKHDKAYLASIASVLIVGMAASIAVTFVFGFGIVPLVLGLVIGVAGLGTIGFSFYKTHVKEQNWLKNNPTLDSFLQELEGLRDERLDDNVKALFKKLPQSDRRSIHSKYLQMSSELPFVSSEFEPLNRDNKFGENYLITALDKIKDPVLLRATQKTCKIFWSLWHQKKDAVAKERAEKIQKFYELLKACDKQGLLGQLEQLKADPGLFAKLTENIYYLSKREESVSQLQKVIQAVQKDRIR